MTTDNAYAIGSALSQPLFIHESAIAANMSIATKYLKGEIKTTDGVEGWRKELAESVPTNGVYSPKWSWESKTWQFDNAINTDNNAVVLLNLRGAITKYDTWCSNGMLTFIDWLKAADNVASVKGIVVSVDSGGGEAMVCEAVAKQMDSMSKPVYFHVHGYMCSACYYIGANATKIYATGQSDIIGSIGTMVTLADYRDYFKEQGINMLEIYADQSTEKNGLYRDAIDGNTTPIKEQMLNPLCQMFIDYVSASRPNINQEVLKGATYLGQSALDNGLIDGFRSLQEVIDEAAGTAQPTVTTNNNLDNESDYEDSQTTPEYMNVIETLKGIFGLKSDASQEELVASAQSAATNAKLNADFEARLVALESKETPQAFDASELVAKIEALQTAKTEADTQISNLSTDLAKVKLSATAKPAANAGNEPPSLVTTEDKKPFIKK